MAEAREDHAVHLLDLVNDAARAVNTRFVTFLTVGVYIAVTIAATTDEMLVRGSPVTLPLLNKDIPISGQFGFYTVAPWLIVVLHSDLLMQLFRLATKVSHFQAGLSDMGKDQRARVCDRLVNFHYVDFLIRNGSSRFLHLLSGLTVWGNMIVLPLFLLCWTQIRFLPLHDPNVTSWQRLAVVVDSMLVLAFLWRPLSLGSNGLTPERLRSARKLMHKLLSLRTLLLATCAGVLLVCAVADIPGDHERSTMWFELRNLNLQDKVLTADWLPAEVVNALADGDVHQREEQLEKVSRLSFLQGRDLRHAKLSNAVLPRLDLRSKETRLLGADLRWAQMQQVLLDDADLRRAKLEGAQIQGGSLQGTRLGNADLSKAQLQDAKLPRARLTGALLKDAQLQGADLSKAKLQKAHLAGAQLQGAILRAANLRGADLSGAALQGADLSGAYLEGAKLRGAQLQGALLRDASVTREELAEADVRLTDISSVRFAPAGTKTQLDPMCGVPAGACAEPRAPGASPAASAEDLDRFLRDVNRYLVSLGCADAYVARGLTAQALYRDGGDRATLASALVRGVARSKCHGMQLLPPAVKDKLEKRAAPPESNSAPDGGI